MGYSKSFALSMGDPHGIGPEVLLKTLEVLQPEANFRPVVFGSGHYLRALARDLECKIFWDQVEIQEVGPFNYPPQWGLLDRQAGEYALECLKSAILYCRSGHSDLLVTAPVNKKALQMAGFDSPGQTEYIASFFSPARAAMAFLSPLLHVLLITVHVPLKKVPELLDSREIFEKTCLFYEALRRLGISRPRLAVCGLNPHASEEGLFGDEEEFLVRPAIAELCEKYTAEDIQGPLPADTLFWRASQGHFDGVVALYHDQALIPLKLLAFDSAVNTTLGLPIVRTSPDHGTAFDIAGQGKADPGSMLSAIRWGLRLARPRDRQEPGAR